MRNPNNLKGGTDDMNLFEMVKASVSVPDAAKMYGIDVTRHNMARCLFHDDRHPSLKLNPDFYWMWSER